MATVKAFSGFPAEGVQFLRDLEQNNNREWFEAHKVRYVDAVQEPALALVVALGERLHAEFPSVHYDARTNGGSLTRIYRDTRFSADKTPYKTSIAMMFTSPGHKRMEAPGFGLQITTQQVDLVAGLFGFSKPQLESYRQAVLDEAQGRALEEATAQVEAAGDYPLGGKELKRVPREYDADHPRAEWLKYKGLHVFSPPIDLETAESVGLVEVAMGHFRNMAPVYHWLTRVLDTD